jgi:lysine 6-dehydrogenase
MKMLVLGAGLQGSAAALDLLRNPAVERVTIADIRPVPLPPFLSRVADARLESVVLDVSDHDAVRVAMRQHHAVLSAIPYYFNGPLAALAVECGVHFSDLGGNTDIVFEQKKLHDRAVAAGVSVIPDCGVAPGMVNILAAEGIRRLQEPKEVRIFVGGLPQHPEPPLNYQIVYSLEGALDYYTTQSWILRDGTPTQIDALSEVEAVEFAAPVGTLEAFHTAGGVSTLPFAYAGQLDVIEYKTLRYPGHVALMRAIRDLGLISNDPITVKGQSVVPRDVFIAAVHPKLHKPAGRDLVALKVVARGFNDGQPADVTFELVDRYDEVAGVSAMMRCTAYSLSITAQMQVDGRVTSAGVFTPDEAMPFRAYVEELAARGVSIRESGVGAPIAATTAAR